jgi:predicted nucleotidyltransferase
MIVRTGFPQNALATLCQRYRVRKLRVFGSALRDDFGPDSDIDLLVEFAEGVRVGLFTLGALQMDLSELLGREVDLKTAGFLSPRFRQQVIDNAEVIYEV